MTSELIALRFSANDAPALARFWAGVLGREVADETDLLPDDETGFRIRFVAAPTEKTRPNQMHLDLTSVSLDDQQETVARAIRLGARHIDVGQTADEGHVVLADPEGNELCVIEPFNDFLDGCGPIGALASDGTQQVGYFWSAALGWPLVWDQDQETAIQSPRGGTKITWAGPPVAPRTGPNRLSFELAVEGDVAAEVDRLVSLGARRLGGDENRVELTDPDGNEFVVRSADHASSAA